VKTKKALQESCLTEEKRQPAQLKWSMTILMLLCWLLPLAILTMAILTYVSNRFSGQMKENIEKTMDTAVEICEMRVEAAVRVSRNASYIPEIKESWRQYQADGDRLDLYERVTTFLEQMYRYDSSFLSTILYFTEEPERIYYSYSSNNYDSIKQFKSLARERVEQKAQEIDTGIGWVNERGHLYMVRNIMTPVYRPYAVIVMDIDKDSVFQSVEGIPWYLDYDVSIDGEWVFGTGWAEDFIRRESAERYSEYHEEKDVAYVTCERKMDSHVIRYVVKLDYDAIHYEKEAIRYITILMMAFTIPLIFIVFYFLYRKVTMPVKRLIDAASEIEKGHFGVQIEKKEKSREFLYLDNAFNSMSDKLKNQFEQIYLEELALRDANIMALQSQINPHFLNNTLEIINWEARMEGNDRVSSMIEALSTMLEATMDRKKQQMIPLSEEISYVEAYCHIIRQRFGEKFQFEKQIDPKLLQTEVPRLIIQPIMENAVEHGLAGRAGKIVLRIYAEADKLKIEIINDGLMTKEDKKKVEDLLGSGTDSGEQHSVSLGICNVNKRLQIIYGPDCGLTIKNDKEDCTVSTITVKLHK
jgi:sensor histidine kinase YesM